MQVMAVAAEAQAGDNTSITDPAMLATVIGSILGTLGAREGIARVWTRKRDKADLTNVLVDGAIKMLEPYQRTITSMEERHAAETRDIRAQHAGAMERVMQQLGELTEKHARLERAYETIAHENADLRGRIAVAGGA